MKLNAIFSLLTLLGVTNARNNPVNNNGANCDLEVSPIVCVLIDSGEPCDTYERFDRSQCDGLEDELDLKIGAQYTFTYTNKGSGKIKFLVGMNPENDKEYTFANANRGAVNIKRGQRLDAGATKTFTVARNLLPCQTVKAEEKPKFRFVAEHRMNGFIVGRESEPSYKCSGGDFYSHKIVPFRSATTGPTATPTASPTDMPTAAPTDMPTAAPTDMPTAAPTDMPTAAPTDMPTAAPTDTPTAAPTAYPTSSPTAAPTAAPTAYPTKEGKGKGGKGKSGSRRYGRYLGGHD